MSIYLVISPAWRPRVPLKSSIAAASCNARLHQTAKFTSFWLTVAGKSILAAKQFTRADIDAVMEASAEMEKATKTLGGVRVVLDLQLCQKRPLSTKADVFVRRVLTSWTARCW